MQGQLNGLACVDRSLQSVAASFFRSFTINWYKRQTGQFLGFLHSGCFTLRRRDRGRESHYRLTGRTGEWQRCGHCVRRHAGSTGTDTHTLRAWGDQQRGLTRHTCCAWRSISYFSSCPLLLLVPSLCWGIWPLLLSTATPRRRFS